MRVMQKFWSNLIIKSLVYEVTKIVYICIIVKCLKLLPVILASQL